MRIHDKHILGSLSEFSDGEQVNSIYQEELLHPPCIVPPREIRVNSLRPDPSR